ncbi:DNA polymerase theta-like [Macrobrachium nipponense]|uniref:DNA polymerase theta-like n=1 Tax=Macrobrachium nipponense TaxID=159736 RepID=UPI0030C88895
MGLCHIAHLHLVLIQQSDDLDPLPKVEEKEKMGREASHSLILTSIRTVTPGLIGVQPARVWVVFPLQHERVFSKYLGMDRIHPRIHMHTATGRVTMHDPNLQTVPRDFNIQKEIKGTSDGNCGLRKQQQALSNSRIMTQLAPLLTQEFEDYTISLRHALVAHPENILLAADLFSAGTQTVSPFGS